jgi:hypothetical protein
MGSAMASALPGLEESRAEEGDVSLNYFCSMLCPKPRRDIRSKERSMTEEVSILALTTTSTRSADSHAGNVAT